MTKDWWYYWE